MLNNMLQRGSDLQALSEYMSCEPRARRVPPLKSPSVRRTRVRALFGSTSFHGPVQVLSFGVEPDLRTHALSTSASATTLGNSPLLACPR